MKKGGTSSPREYKITRLLSVGCALILLVFCSSLSAKNLTILHLLSTHLSIGMEKENSSTSPQNLPASFSDILAVQQGIKNQLSTDVVAELDLANSEPARLLILETYLSRSQHLLTIANSLLERETTAIGEYNNKIKDCETPINQLNTDFTLAIQRYDFVSSQQISATIATKRACIAENTVYYREHIAYRESTLAVQTSLQKRVDYIITNKEKIAQYYTLLKPQLLKELYDISQTLEVNYTSK